jgi:transcriptional regulator with XRE-family HTH domain
METAALPSMSTDPGGRLRTLRSERGWTLSDVAQRTGLAVPTLSKLENGKMSFSYDKMVRIATGLGVDIGVLFASGAQSAPSAPPAETGATSGRRSVTRQGEGRVIETSASIQHYPAADLLNKQLVPIVYDVLARSLQEHGDLLGHPGEEFVLVLEGTLELHSQFYAPTVLEVGDSIYFDSSMAHGYVATGAGPCRILSVVSTADWGPHEVARLNRSGDGRRLRIVGNE